MSAWPTLNRVNAYVSYLAAPQVSSEPTLPPNRLDQTLPIGSWEVQSGMFNVLSADILPIQAGRV